MIEFISVRFFCVLVAWLFLVETAPVQESVPIGRTPRQKGCFYLSDHYDNGERIDTNEPCLNCTCLNSMLMCYLRICPFVKPVGEECIVERDEGDCCPKIWCPEVIKDKDNESPSSEEKRGQHPGCYLNDQYYPDGAQLPRDSRRPCEVCYCIRNSTACVMQECELKVEGCSPIYKEGQCCPCRYNCTYEEATPTPPGVTLTELAEGCYLSDEIFVADGEAVNSTNPCEHCYCMRNEVVCAIQECQAPGDSCKPVPPKPDQCCPDRYECVVDSISPGGFKQPQGSGLTFSTVFTTADEPTVSFGLVDIPTDIVVIQDGSRIKGAPKKEVLDEISPVYRPPYHIDDVEIAVKESSTEEASSTKQPENETVTTSASQEGIIMSSSTTESTSFEDIVSEEISTNLSDNETKLIHIASEEAPMQGVEVIVEGHSEYSSVPLPSSFPEAKSTSKVEDSHTITTQIPRKGVKGGVKGSSFGYIPPKASTSVPEEEKDLHSEGIATQTPERALYYDTTQRTQPTLEENDSIAKETYSSLAEDSVTEASPGSSYYYTIPSTQQVFKDDDSYFKESSTPPPTGIRVKGRKPAIPTIFEASSEMPVDNNDLQGDDISDATSVESSVSQPTGVKTSQKQDNLYNVKGNRPQKPILPMGVIPGENTGPTTTTYRPSIKGRPVVKPIPGEGTCRANGITYKDGQSVQSTDVCKKRCECIKGRIFCVATICEMSDPELYEDCQIVKNPDQCCPHYECGTLITKPAESIDISEFTYVDGIFVSTKFPEDSTTKQTDIYKDTFTTTRPTKTTISPTTFESSETMTHKADISTTKESSRFFFGTTPEPPSTTVIDVSHADDSFEIPILTEISDSFSSLEESKLFGTEATLISTDRPVTIVTTTTPEDAAISTTKGTTLHHSVDESATEKDDVSTSKEQAAITQGTDTQPTEETSPKLDTTKAPTEELTTTVATAPTTKETSESIRDASTTETSSNFLVNGTLITKEVDDESHVNDAFDDSTVTVSTNAPTTEETSSLSYSTTKIPTDHSISEVTFIPITHGTSLSTEENVILSTELPSTSFVSTTVVPLETEVTEDKQESSYADSVTSEETSRSTEETSIVSFGSTIVPEHAKDTKISHLSGGESIQEETTHSPTTRQAIGFQSSTVATPITDSHGISDQSTTTFHTTQDTNYTSSLVGETFNQADSVTHLEDPTISPTSLHDTDIPKSDILTPISHPSYTSTSDEIEHIFSEDGLFSTYISNTTVDTHKPDLTTQANGGSESGLTMETVESTLSSSESSISHEGYLPSSAQDISPESLHAKKRPGEEDKKELNATISYELPVETVQQFTGTSTPSKLSTGSTTESDLYISSEIPTKQSAASTTVETTSETASGDYKGESTATETTDSFIKESTSFSFPTESSEIISQEAPTTPQSEVNIANFHTIPSTVTNYDPSESVTSTTRYTEISPIVRHGYTTLVTSDITDGTKLENTTTSVASGITDGAKQTEETVSIIHVSNIQESTISPEKSFDSTKESSLTTSHAELPTQTDDDYSPISSSLSHDVHLTTTSHAELPTQTDDDYSPISSSLSHDVHLTISPYEYFTTQPSVSDFVTESGLSSALGISKPIEESLISKENTSVSDEAHLVSFDGISELETVAVENVSLSDGTSPSDKGESEDGSFVSEESTLIPEEITSISGEGISISKEGTTLPEDSTLVPEKGTSVSEKDVPVSESVTIAEKSPSVSEDETAVSDEGISSVQEGVHESLPQEGYSESPKDTSETAFQGLIQTPHHGISESEDSQEGVSESHVENTESEEGTPESHVENTESDEGTPELHTSQGPSEYLEVTNKPQEDQKGDALSEKEATAIHQEGHESPKSTSEPQEGSESQKGTSETQEGAVESSEETENKTGSEFPESTHVSALESDINEEKIISSTSEITAAFFENTLSTINPKEDKLQSADSSSSTFPEQTGIEQAGTPTTQKPELLISTEIDYSHEASDSSKTEDSSSYETSFDTEASLVTEAVPVTEAVLVTKEVPVTEIPLVDIVTDADNLIVSLIDDKTVSDTTFHLNASSTTVLPSTSTSDVSYLLSTSGSPSTKVEPTSETEISESSEFTTPTHPTETQPTEVSEMVTKDIHGPGTSESSTSKHQTTISSDKEAITDHPEEEELIETFTDAPKQTERPQSHVISVSPSESPIPSTTFDKEIPATVQYPAETIVPDKIDEGSFSNNETEFEEGSFTTTEKSDATPAVSNQPDATESHPIILTDSTAVLTSGFEQGASATLSPQSEVITEVIKVEDSYETPGDTENSELPSIIVTTFNPTKEEEISTTSPGISSQTERGTSTITPDKSPITEYITGTSRPSQTSTPIPVDTKTILSGVTDIPVESTTFISGATDIPVDSMTVLPNSTDIQVDVTALSGATDIPVDVTTVISDTTDTSLDITGVPTGQKEVSLDTENAAVAGTDETLSTTLPEFQEEIISEIIRFEKDKEMSSISSKTKQTSPEISTEPTEFIRQTSTVSTSPTENWTSTSVTTIGSETEIKDDDAEKGTKEPFTSWSSTIVESVTPETSSISDFATVTENIHISSTPEATTLTNPEFVKDKATTELYDLHSTGTTGVFQELSGENDSDTNIIIYQTSKYPIETPSEFSEDNLTEEKSSIPAETSSEQPVTNEKLSSNEKGYATDIYSNTSTTHHPAPHQSDSYTNTTLLPIEEEMLASSTQHSEVKRSTSDIDVYMRETISTLSVDEIPFSQTTTVDNSTNFMEQSEVTDTSFEESTKFPSTTVISPLSGIIVGNVATSTVEQDHVHYDSKFTTVHEFDHSTEQTDIYSSPSEEILESSGADFDEKSHVTKQELNASITDVHVHYIEQSTISTPLHSEENAQDYVTESVINKYDGIKTLTPEFDSKYSNSTEEIPTTIKPEISATDTERKTTEMPSSILNNDLMADDKITELADSKLQFSSTAASPETTSQSELNVETISYGFGAGSEVLGSTYKPQILKQFTSTSSFDNTEVSSNDEELETSAHQDSLIDDVISSITKIILNDVETDTKKNMSGTSGFETTPSNLINKDLTQDYGFHKQTYPPTTHKDQIPKETTQTFETTKETNELTEEIRSDFITSESPLSITSEEEVVTSIFEIHEKSNSTSLEAESTTTANPKISEPEISYMETTKNNDSNVMISSPPFIPENLIGTFEIPLEQKYLPNKTTDTNYLNLDNIETQPISLDSLIASAEVIKSETSLLISTNADELSDIYSSNITKIGIDKTGIDKANVLPSFEDHENFTSTTDGVDSTYSSTSTESGLSEKPGFETTPDQAINFALTQDYGFHKETYIPLKHEEKYSTDNYQSIEPVEHTTSSSIYTETSTKFMIENKDVTDASIKESIFTQTNIPTKETSIPDSSETLLVSSVTVPTSDDIDSDLSKEPVKVLIENLTYEEVGESKIPTTTETANGINTTVFISTTADVLSEISTLTTEQEVEPLKMLNESLETKEIGKHESSTSTNTTGPMETTIVISTFEPTISEINTSTSDFDLTSTTEEGEKVTKKLHTEFYPIIPKKPITSHFEYDTEEPVTKSIIGLSETNTKHITSKTTIKQDVTDAPQVENITNDSHSDLHSIISVEATTSQVPYEAERTVTQSSIGLSETIAQQTETGEISSTIYSSESTSIRDGVDDGFFSTTTSEPSKLIEKSSTFSYILSGRPSETTVDDRYSLSNVNESITPLPNLTTLFTDDSESHLLNNKTDEHLEILSENESISDVSLDSSTIFGEDEITNETNTPHSHFPSEKSSDTSVELAVHVTESYQSSSTPDKESELFSTQLPLEVTSFAAESDGIYTPKEFDDITRPELSNKNFSFEKDITEYHETVKPDVSESSIYATQPHTELHSIIHVQHTTRHVTADAEESVTKSYTGLDEASTKPTAFETTSEYPSTVFIHTEQHSNITTHAPPTDSPLHTGEIEHFTKLHKATTISPLILRNDSTTFEIHTQASDQFTTVTLPEDHSKDPFLPESVEDHSSSQLVDHSRPVSDHSKPESVDHSTPKSVEKHSTPESVEEHSTPESVEEHSTPESVEEHSTAESVEDHALPELIEDNSRPEESSETLSTEESIPQTTTSLRVTDNTFAATGLSDLSHSVQTTLKSVIHDESMVLTDIQSSNQNETIKTTTLNETFSKITESPDVSTSIYPLTNISLQIKTEGDNSSSTDVSHEAVSTTVGYTTSSELHKELLETVASFFPHSSPPSIITESHDFSSTTTDHHHKHFTAKPGDDSHHNLPEDGYCLYENEVYNSAEQIPRKDPCEFCFCFRGDIICLQQSCPPPVRGCYATPINGFCCPRFHCPVQEMHFNMSTTTTTTADPRMSKRLIVDEQNTGCEIEGRIYRVHQVVRPASGPCMLCRCELGGMMKCDPRDCQPQAPLLLRLNSEFFRKR